MLKSTHKVTVSPMFYLQKDEQLWLDAGSLQSCGLARAARIAVEQPTVLLGIRLCQALLYNLSLRNIPLLLFSSESPLNCYKRSHVLPSNYISLRIARPDRIGGTAHAQPNRKVRRKAPCKKMMDNWATSWKILGLICATGDDDTKSHRDYNFIGYKVACIHELLGLLPIFSLCRHLGSQQVACGDMCQAVLPATPEA